MKKISILFIAVAMAFAVSSCSKDEDDNANNNNTGGSGGGQLDVWAAAEGTYTGDAITSTGGSTPNMKVVITKISDSKLKLEPGAGNNIVLPLEIDVIKGDTSINHQAGVFNGQFFIIANATPPQLILSDNQNNVTYQGLKD